MGHPEQPTSPAAADANLAGGFAIESLRRRRDFTLVLGEGRRSRHGSVAVAARANGLQVTRVGYAVGRRVGGAVVRNRVRRRLRALVRVAVPLALDEAAWAAAPTPDQLSYAPPGPLTRDDRNWDIVLTALADSTKTPFDVIARELKAALAGALGTSAAPRRRPRRPAVEAVAP